MPRRKLLLLKKFSLHLKFGATTPQSWCNTESADICLPIFAYQSCVHCSWAFLYRALSWVFDYDPETKRQSMEWHTLTFPMLTEARMGKSNMKSMLICFFYSQGNSLCLSLCQSILLPKGSWKTSKNDCLHSYLHLWNNFLVFFFWVQQKILLCSSERNCFLMLDNISFEY